MSDQEEFYKTLYHQWRRIAFTTLSEFATYQGNIKVASDCLQTIDRWDKEDAEVSTT